MNSDFKEKSGQEKFVKNEEIGSLGKFKKYFKKTQKM